MTNTNPLTRTVLVDGLPMILGFAFGVVEIPDTILTDEEVVAFAEEVHGGPVEERPRRGIYRRFRAA